MSRNGRVIVALSGGVDSSVAAYLLREQGYECIGAFMRVGAAPAGDEAPANGDGCTTGSCEPRPRRLRHGCCSASDAQDARVVAGRLGLPFYALNFERDFERIIDYFVDEYVQARTPNPCVMCNIHVKFGKLLRYAEAMDAEFIATGHYARVLPPDDASEPGSDGAGWRLARAANRAKDQSYVLFGIAREALPRCLFPLGGFADKRQVREIAAALGLRVHDKPDSQEICFVPEGDFTTLIDRRRPGSRQAGDIRDVAGSVVGRHDGVASYTIGQRRGLGLALGYPAYVTQLDVVGNTVTVGRRDELLATGLIAARINWLTDPPPIGLRQSAAIKIRHMHEPAAGWIERRGDECVAAGFDAPQLAVTPGQAAVFYSGDVVLGGGWIEQATT